MIPEIGHFALILALTIASIQGLLPLIGIRYQLPSLKQIAKPAALAQLVFLSLAYGCLTLSFINHDFSVRYVALNSNRELPFMYLVSGVWGSHEGSLMLWALSLSVWTVLVSCSKTSIANLTKVYVLSILGLISTGFLAFILFTSNPFLRQFPYPKDGRDLNPLLQDPGLALHPPLLYFGYVGFAIPFAFAIASLLEGKLDSAWAKWVRPWAQSAWLFLTLGITLGSWWAYYELGWGGWWFWDPVENASFMPWLVGTALIHTLAVTEKRGLFKSWTVLLAISCFSLSLFGTFLVRSGVLTSVHAFASDPARGLFMLIFLGMVVGSSLLLFALRAPLFDTVSQFQPVSRESALLINNLLLVITAACILLGTVYPIIIDALGLGKLSVGAPYFNAIFVPLMAPLGILVGLGMVLHWKSDQLRRLSKPLLGIGVATISLGMLLPLAMPFYSLTAAFGLILAIWIVLITGYQFKRGLPAGVYGMSIAHLGIASFVIGISFSSVYSLERDIRLANHESVDLYGYQLTLEGVENIQAANYTAHQARLSVHYQQQYITELKPEKRRYHSSKMPLTEAAIDAGVFRDLFVALGEAQDENGTWSLRVYYKAFIRWIWMGGLMMALGAFLAASERRYHKTEH